MDVVDPSSDQASVETTSPELMWLQWVYSIMNSIQGVCLWRFDELVDPQKPTPVRVAQWPQFTVDHALCSSLVMRAWRNLRIQKVPLNGDSIEQTILLAIPEPDNTHRPRQANQSSAQYRRRWVLLVECGASSKQQIETLIKLGPMIMGSLVWIGSNAGCVEPRRSLASEIIKYISCNDPAVYRYLLDALCKRTASKRCYIVPISRDGRECKKNELVAVSGQAYVDQRLPVAAALGQSVRDVYNKNALSMTVVREVIEKSDPSFEYDSGRTEWVARLLVPVTVDNLTYVVGLERDSSLPFTNEESKLVERELLVALPACVVSDPVRLRLRTAIRRSIRNCSDFVRNKFHSGIYWFPAVCLFIAFVTVPVDERISAQFSIEAVEKHVLVAPGNGYLKAVFVTAGDRVSEGEVLAALDDQKLKLQQSRWHSELRQNRQDLARALSVRDRMEISRLKAKGLLINAEIQHLAIQLERYKLRSPLSGVVLSGQWMDSMGAAVELGDVLFEIGNDTHHRLVLNVSEKKVANIRPGQSVGFRLTAAPDLSLRGQVTAALPVAFVKDGRNYINVHASVTETDKTSLRPGMTGVAKIQVGRRTMPAQWLDKLKIPLIWLAWKLGVMS